MNLIPKPLKSIQPVGTTGLNQRFSLTDVQIQSIIRRIGLKLQLAVEISGLKHEPPDGSRIGTSSDPFQGLIACARQAGIQIVESQLTISEVLALLEEDFPVVIALDSGPIWVLEDLSGRHIEASQLSANQLTIVTLDKRQLRGILKSSGDTTRRIFAVKKELECSTISTAPAGNLSAHQAGGRHGIHDGPHLKPMHRFLGMLRLDQRDLWTIALFALVAGILTLATPLAVESLVNVVIWGTLVQPLIVLGLMLLMSLGLAGVLRILQAVMAEIIQRRQFVRIVGDLANRFPRANRQAIEGAYPRELVNRVFDIMTIQKSTAVLLLDGISIVLASATGMLLLSLYHPFLLFFNLVLLTSMVSITWLLGRGGIRTAVDESLAKYRLAYWLQDVLATPSAFKVNGGGNLAVERAQRLTAEYLSAREAQFRVVIRQVAFATGLQVIASTVLLGLARISHTIRK